MKPSEFYKYKMVPYSSDTIDFLEGKTIEATDRSSNCLNIRFTDGTCICIESTGHNHIEVLDVQDETRSEFNDFPI